MEMQRGVREAILVAAMTMMTCGGGAAAAGIVARCVQVDGCGTIVTQWRGQTLRVGVDGVGRAVGDARQCRAVLAEMVLNQVVWVDFSAAPRSGRARGVVRLGWTNVGDELVRRGVARRPSEPAAAVAVATTARWQIAQRPAQVAMTHEEVQRERWRRDMARRLLRRAAEDAEAARVRAARRIWTPLSQVTEDRVTVQVEVAALRDGRCTTVCVEVGDCGGCGAQQFSSVDARREAALRLLRCLGSGGGANCCQRGVSAWPTVPYHSPFQPPWRSTVD